MHTRLLLPVVSACALLASTACTATTATSSPTPVVTVTPTATVTPSATPSASVSTQPPASTTVATAVITTVAPAPESSSSAQASGSESAKEIVPVDPKKFQRPDGYFFTTPSGKIFCGGGGPHFGASIIVGCQTFQPVAGMSNCEGNDKFSPMVVVERGQTVAKKSCSTQGVFVTGEPREVLEYGQGFTVPGEFSCTSRETGVTCSSHNPPVMFTIAREGITTP